MGSWRKKYASGEHAELGMDMQSKFAASLREQKGKL